MIYKVTGQFSENNIDHYRSLLESTEMGIPCHLREARLVAMEALFLFAAPLASMDDSSPVEPDNDDTEGFGISGLNGMQGEQQELD